MNRFRITILLAALTGVLAIAAPSQAALPKLTGTVGPGFTITLTKLGKKVITLKAGTYSITVVGQVEHPQLPPARPRSREQGDHRDRLRRDEDRDRQARQGHVHVRLRPALHRR